MNDGMTEARLAALDECALGLNRVEAITQLALADPEQAEAALLSIMGCVSAAKGHVMDIVRGLEER
jgi:hypothetical protein